MKQRRLRQGLIKQEGRWGPAQRALRGRNLRGAGAPRICGSPRRLAESDEPFPASRGAGPRAARDHQGTQQEKFRRQNRFGRPPVRVDPILSSRGKGQGTAVTVSPGSENGRPFSLRVDEPTAAWTYFGQFCLKRRVVEIRGLVQRMQLGPFIGEKK